jgi:hypothetical protein
VSENSIGVVAVVLTDVRVSGGPKVTYGTFDGVYFQDLREPNREPIKVLALTDVAQVDVLDDYGLLIVLSGAWVSFSIIRRLTVASF